MSEALIQTALKNELLTLSSTFAAGDVTINDTHILDGPPDNAPFAIVESADDFSLIRAETQWENTWEMPVSLFVLYTDSDDANNALTTLRDTVLAHLSNPANLSDTNIALKWGIQSVRPSGPIEVWYEAARAAEAEASETALPLPLFLGQRLIVTVLEIRIA